MTRRSAFTISLSKDSLVFAAAHFITLPGHRCEPLHGHNYRTRVAVEGDLDPEAHFVVDFAALKTLMLGLTGELDHKVLLALHNPKLAIEERGDVVSVCFDGKPRYVFPRLECALLPIPNTTVEMLAQYLAGRARAELERDDAVRVQAIEVEVEENFGQSATYREALA